MGILLAFAVLASAPAAMPQAKRTQSHGIVDAKSDVVSFYGVPMNLKPADLKRYRYKVGHFSAEGDTYTFYTLKAERGVQVDIQFHKGKLVSARTSSPNAIGPRGVGIGSPLSAVEAAWPEGRATFGIQENDTYVTFEAAEPGFMPNVYYYFDPKDMPPHAFEGEIWKKSVDLIPKDIRVKTIGIFPREFPEETYNFLALTTGPCVSKSGVRMRSEQLLACKRMTPKRRYRGTWLVTPQASLFAPAGNPSCIDAAAMANCAELVGKHLDWLRPYYRDACPILYQLEFIGRRNVLPGSNPAYRIEVEEVLADQVLPNAPKGPPTCKEPFVTGTQEGDPSITVTTTPPER